MFRRRFRTRAVVPFPAKFLTNWRVELRIGLQAYPPSGAAGIEKPGVRSNPGAHFEDVAL